MKPIFHITTDPIWAATDWDGEYRGDTLDEEGFIHASEESQLLATAARIFVGREDLMLVMIDEELVQPPVRRENLEGGEELFPHIYGPLNLDAVVSVTPFPPDEDGSFRWPPSLPGFEGETP